MNECELTPHNHTELFLQCMLNDNTSTIPEVRNHLQAWLKALLEKPGGFIILNKNGEAITATAATLQSVATTYIQTNYGRLPKDKDGLIITLTDQGSDAVLYVYAETSSLWFNPGVDVDLSNYYTKSETDSLLSSKADKLATVKDTTTADITVAATANTNYIYGELTDLTITWGTGSDNAEISFMFKSGATATTLAISTTGAKFSSYAPSANAIVEISAKWYLDAWVVLFHETAVA